MKRIFSIFLLIMFLSTNTSVFAAPVLEGHAEKSEQLRKELELSGAIFHTTSDTEIIAYILTKEMLRGVSTEQAITESMNKLEGAYSLIIMTSDKLYAVRDPHGFRLLQAGFDQPLSRSKGQTPDHVCADPCSGI